MFSGSPTTIRFTPCFSMSSHRARRSVRKLERRSVVSACPVIDSSSETATPIVLVPTSRPMVRAIFRSLLESQSSSLDAQSSHSDNDNLLVCQTSRGDGGFAALHSWHPPCKVRARPLSQEWQGGAVGEQVVADGRWGDLLADGFFRPQEL